MAESSAAENPIPANTEIIDVRVADLLKVFNAIDPAPLRDRDLDGQSQRRRPTAYAGAHSSRAVTKKPTNRDCDNDPVRSPRIGIAAGLMCYR